MRAVLLETFGGPDALKVVTVDRPEPGPDEVLVRVMAAGVNPVDWKARSGAVGERFGAPPYVPGWDVCGVVEARGDAVTGFAVGDEVYGMPRFPQLAGCYAEYVTAPADHLAAKPAGIDHIAAAGLPLAGLTAQQTLDLAGVGAGQRVLVHAAAGGVGHLAVQLAKARDAYVIGTARAEKHAFLRDLGIDEAIDYTATAFEDAVRDVDVVVDPIAGDYSHRSLRTLRPGGVEYVILGGIDEALTAAARAAGVRVDGHLVHPDGPGLARLAELVEAGKLRIAVDRTFPLERAAEAHAYGETNRARGKIVLSVAR